LKLRRVDGRRGTWATVTEVAPERNVAVADREQGQQAGWGMITEAGAGALAGVRLADGIADMNRHSASRRPLPG
jgi:hypothetical protein